MWLRGKEREAVALFFDNSRGAAADDKELSSRRFAEAASV
jgi:hypothetical protein